MVDKILNNNLMCGPSAGDDLEPNFTSGDALPDNFIADSYSFSKNGRNFCSANDFPKNRAEFKKRPSAISHECSSAILASAKYLVSLNGAERQSSVVSANPVALGLLLILLLEKCNDGGYGEGAYITVYKNDASGHDATSEVSHGDVKPSEDVSVDAGVEVEVGVCLADEEQTCKVEGFEDEHCGVQVCDDDGDWGDCEKRDFGTDVKGDPMKCGEPCDDNELLGECHVVGKYVYDAIKNALRCDVSPAPTPTVETCDNLDNDCNGTVDDLGTTTCGVGVCEHTVLKCIDGVEQPCDPLAGASVEVCDGKDNSCDGNVDESTGDPSKSISESCAPSGSPVGCENGTKICEDGKFSACVSNGTTEICDGLDNDCDGIKDNPFTDLGKTCAAGVGSCETIGEYVCSESKDKTECNAKPKDAGAEVCVEGVDNDCDGLLDIDEINGLQAPCDNGEKGACHATGVLACVPGKENAECNAPAGDPQPEVCNEIDDDCNGTVDDDPTVGKFVYYKDADGDGFGSNVEIIKSCTSISPEGYSVVGGDSDDDNKDVYPFAPEICDGLDNDGNGQADDVVGLPPASNQKGVCVGSTQICSPDGGNYSVDPDYTKLANYSSTDSCDGLDNDCDGEIDENATDIDLDGIADCVDPDKDGDEILNLNDNCPAFVNPDQEDIDGDGVGDVCDTDHCDGPAAHCGCEVEGGTKSCGPDTEAGECQKGVQTCEKDANDQLFFSECKGAVFATAEVCDGLDNDCNDKIDDGLGTTTCGTGICEHTEPSCTAGAPVTCDPLKDAKPAESCNGLDDDCDGLVDNKDFSATTCGQGVCEHTVQNCVAGAPVSCDPLEGATSEVCDGLDNNCDGATDEELGSETCGVGECQVTVDKCKDGVPQTCEPKLAGVEICNGKDDDCDGNIDNDPTDGSIYYKDVDGDGFGNDAEMINACAKPVGYSDIGGDCDDTKPLVNPSAVEVCDGVDNDCNGAVDENLGTAKCGTGVCANEVENCKDGMPQVCESKPAGAEICNGLDDDCNDIADDKDFGTTTCGQGACEHTVEKCVEGAPVSCDPLQGATSEVCDGDDNDCNGLADDKDFGTETCGKGPCQNTVSSCVAGVPVACEPKTENSIAEICDGADNDCDGVIDNGMTNTDGDAQCDVIDSDDDNDSLLDANDNCSLVANLGQCNLDNKLDLNGQGGDACATPDTTPFIKVNLKGTTCSGGKPVDKPESVYILSVDGAAPTNCTPLKTNTTHKLELTYCADDNIISGGLSFIGNCLPIKDWSSPGNMAYKCGLNTVKLNSSTPFCKYVVNLDAKNPDGSTCEVTYANF